MAAYRRVYDSRHLQADCQEPGSAQGPYARQSIMGYLYLVTRTDYRLNTTLACLINAARGYTCTLADLTLCCFFVSSPAGIGSIGMSVSVCLNI